MTVTKYHIHSNAIDPTAFRIVETLQKSGFQTYLVGGCVRDILAGIHPKDFDIATNALPEEVKKKIPYSFIIGRRFKLVLVKRGVHQYEIATFRRNKETEDETTQEVEASPIGDNFFGTAEEDAQRRDFTINALFYDPIQKDIIDYCSGLRDIESRTLRMIGPAQDRLLEDPIRILRAIRLSHKLDFQLESELRSGIIATAHSLLQSILPRRREEYLKILKLKDPGRTFLEMYDLGVLQSTLPTLAAIFDNPASADIFLLYMDRLRSTSDPTPTELFSKFVFSYLKASLMDEPIVPDTLETNATLTKFMKDELGMFKLETSDFLRMMEVQTSLMRIDSFKKRGSRRQKAFLSNIALPISLELAYADRSLSSAEYFFWQEQLRKKP